MEMKIEFDNLKRIIFFLKFGHQFESFDYNIILKLVQNVHNITFKFCWLIVYDGTRCVIEKFSLLRERAYSNLCYTSEL